MTCIVGIVEREDGREGVIIGGDSAGIGVRDLSVRADEKVFAIGEFVFGFTTSFRMGQLLRYRFVPPQFVEDADVFGYMVTSFVEGVRQTLKDGGFAKKVNEEESGGTFLVGVRGRLFEIGSDYQVGENVIGFAAVGCGSQVACGAMYASAGRPAEERIRIALEAAERFSAGVRGPFVIKRVGK